MSAKSVATIEHTSKVKALNDTLKRLKRTSVMVGIASGEKGDRRKEGTISNSELGYIHEKGSPAAGIPARPFLEPGVKKIQDTIAHDMGVAMKAALNDDAKEVDTILKQVGMKAVSSVKSYLTEGSFEPLKPETIRNRNRSRMTKGKREEEKRGGGKIKPLINTGQLRDSIDFYIEG